jgi:hypothetical protein
LCYDYDTLTTTTSCEKHLVYNNQSWQSASVISYTSNASAMRSMFGFSHDGDSVVTLVPDPAVGDDMPHVFLRVGSQTPQDLGTANPNFTQPLWATYSHRRNLAVAFPPNNDKVIFSTSFEYGNWMGDSLRTEIWSLSLHGNASSSAVHLWSMPHRYVLYMGISDDGRQAVVHSIDESSTCHMEYWSIADSTKRTSYDYASSWETCFAISPTVSPLKRIPIALRSRNPSTPTVGYRRH